MWQGGDRRLGCAKGEFSDLLHMENLGMSRLMMSWRVSCLPQMLSYQRSKASIGGRGLSYGTVKYFAEFAGGRHGGRVLFLGLQGVLL